MADATASAPHHAWPARDPAPRPGRVAGGGLLQGARGLAWARRFFLFPVLRNRSYTPGRVGVRIRPMKIAVLFGGTSQERDVSIASAAQIIPALRSLGHDVIAIDTVTGRLTADAETKMLTSGVGRSHRRTTALANMRESALALTSNASDIRDVDVVFLALHGGAGEDGRVQAVLDLAGMAYTGSNHIARCDSDGQGSVEASVSSGRCARRQTGSWHRFSPTMSRRASAGRW